MAFGLCCGFGGLAYLWIWWIPGFRGLAWGGIIYLTVLDFWIAVGVGVDGVAFGDLRVFVVGFA